MAKKRPSNTAKKAEINAEARRRNGLDGGGVTPKPQARPKERRGLDWLFHKERITRAQYESGVAYGKLYRRVEAHGREPLRSCLDDSGGGGGGVPGFSHAGQDIDACDALDEIHLIALRSEAHMIATVAAICGRQFTPREITTDHAETVEIETTLRLALNLIGNHLEGRKAA